VSRVLRGRPAADAGFRYGDALLAVDGRPIASASEFSDYVAPRANQSIEVQVDRNGDLRHLRVVPAEVDGEGLIGIEIRSFHYQRYGPIRALGAAWSYNVDTTRQIFSFLGKIFERRIAAHSALGGPIEIAAISGAAARSGYRDLANLMAIISLNLFILNLLPVPILDGGQILVLLIESTLRRDFSLPVKERMTQVGLVMIVMLMVMALYFDLMKNLPGLR
jgi:regulator of sigma E protease